MACARMFTQRGCIAVLTLLACGLFTPAARAQCGLPPINCTGALYCGGDWDFEAGFVWVPHALAGQCSPDDGDNQQCVESNRLAHVGTNWFHWADWPDWPVSGYYGFANFNVNQNCANTFRGERSQEITLTCSNGLGLIYRTAAVPVGHNLRVTAEMKFTPNDPGFLDTEQHLGLDPSGNTDPEAPTVQWFLWDQRISSPPQLPNVFNHTEEEIVATTGMLTVFIRLKAWQPSCIGQTFMIEDVRIYDLGAQGPVIERSPAALSAATLVGEDAASQTFTIRNASIGTLDYSITDDAEWLSIDPAVGDSTGEPDTIDVYYDTDTLPADDYSATITITAPGASNSPQEIDVQLSVTHKPGDFDGDGDVDQEDYGVLQACFSGPGVPAVEPFCEPAKLDGDEDVDQNDFSIFQVCMSGPNAPSDPDCAD